MIRPPLSPTAFRSLLAGALWLIVSAAASGLATPGSAASRTQKRWLFVWRDLSKPAEVDRVIARLPRAQADGYNGLALPYNVAPERAAALRQAARQHGMEIVAIVMGGAHDRNGAEGVLSQDALFLVHHGRATLQPDNPTRVLNGDFEAVTGNHFQGWSLQDDEGLTTFADHTVVHGGHTALRMENIGKNPYRHCRLSQPLKLQPHRQYRISFWLKAQGLTPADPEVKVLLPDASRPISFQTFHTEPDQDWKQYDLVFNSLDETGALLYLGSWYGKDGKVWWDDLTVEEIGLVNVLRRPGCPVTVRGENGTLYEEGRDYERLVDPQLSPWRAYHTPPPIRVAANSRISEGERLRVSYYHPLIAFEDRVTHCLSEEQLFTDWREEVRVADERLHPAAFLMSHDELRVINQCALCRSKHLTAGELLAWNVRRSARIIRDLRPDAEIWVWNDMFDPMHNAVDHYFAVNGSLAGSWKGLDPSIGIVNWHGEVLGKNCRFFADLGLKQILSGYYDGDEDGARIARWFANTRDVPGIVGAMYTTWEDRYEAMDAWARRAWGAQRP